MRFEPKIFSFVTIKKVDFFFFNFLFNKIINEKKEVLGCIFHLLHIHVFGVEKDKHKASLTLTIRKQQCSNKTIPIKQTVGIRPTYLNKLFLVFVTQTSH